jgi:hypothetical protein
MIAHGPAESIRVSPRPFCDEPGRCGKMVSALLEEAEECGEEVELIRV